MLLQDIIIQKIQKNGPLSFRHFMDMALYYPDLGYYTGKTQVIGPEGDFFTSCTLSPVFGVLLARQVEEIWYKMGKGPFKVIEYGAGTGALCSAILKHLRSNEELYDRLEYCILEKSPVMREKEKAVVNDKVKWYEHLSEIKNAEGCIISNELVDNFPVHVVEMRDELMEVCVNFSGGRFNETLVPAGDELKNYFSELRVDLMKGYRAEVNLEAVNWMRDIATCMKKGYVITIDYGDPSSEIYSKPNGTLKCFYSHKINYSPFSNIGQQDITADVNFSALCLWGHKFGLNYCGFREQAGFLMALGYNQVLKHAQQAPTASSYRKEAFLTNLLIHEMGKKFKVLIQEKDGAGRELLGLAA
jgi:SAM-dependent MidA family methyltransferase